MTELHELKSRIVALCNEYEATACDDEQVFVAVITHDRGTGRAEKGVFTHGSGELFEFTALGMLAEHFVRSLPPGKARRVRPAMNDTLRQIEREAGIS